MRSDIRTGAVALGLFSVLTGIVYPLTVTAIGAVALPRQAAASLVIVRDTVRGSALVGQPFTSPRYLWPRPSATATPYDARASSGSNLGPTNPALDSMVRARIAALRAANPGAPAAVPVDLVTASASGLDPDVSPAAAQWQAGRIARARAADSSAIAHLIEAHTTPRTFGILGEPRVNVLRVNLALDSLSQATATRHP